MAWPLAVTSDSAECTKAVAARLASVCRAGDVLLLIGELGAGKTAFAQGFAAGLGVEGPVTSPTFALVRQYACAEGGPADTLIHADVYRTESVGEVLELALAELVEEQAIALIEWGDMAAAALGDDALAITLSRPEGTASTETRTIALEGRGAWLARADDVARALAGATTRAEP
jgi:tRNA threonylcarbamoyladenosine biosynthesis protein TsaE